MPTVDFTKDELLNEIRVIVDETKQEIRGEMQQVKSELRTEIKDLKGALRGEMQDMKIELRDEMKQMRNTWEENYIAEVNRVSRIDKRLRRHSGDQTVHRA